MAHESNPTRAPAAPDPDSETGRRVYDDPHGRVAALYPAAPVPASTVAREECDCGVGVGGVHADACALDGIAQPVAASELDADAEHDDQDIFGLPPLPMLPKWLLTVIGEYGMARTDRVDPIPRWEMLIKGIKRYAEAYARTACAADRAARARATAESAPASAAPDATEQALNADRYIEVVAAFLSRDQERIDAMHYALTRCEWWADTNRRVDEVIATYTAAPSNSPVGADKESK